MEEDNLPSLLPELQSHLKDLENPSQAIDTRLFDKFEAQLTNQLPQSLLESLVVQLSSLLLVIQQDPTPLNHLIIKLTEALTFLDILSLNSPVNFSAGLQVSAQPFNILTLTLLRKAALNASDAAIVASKPEIVGALIDLWLSTPDVGVAQKADELLWELLKVDFSGASHSPHQHQHDGMPEGTGCGQGLAWRRVFKDRDIYGKIFSICSLKSDLALGKREKTLAQARLLDIIPRIGTLDWGRLQSQHADVERRYNLKEGEGLLQFAALHMVDTKEDVLMHLALIDFFSALLQSHAEEQSLPASATSLNTIQNTSPPLDFLISSKLHSRTSAWYLDSMNPNLDPMDVSFLFNRSANYLSTYASCYPSHLLRVPAEDSVSIERMLSCIAHELDNSRAQVASPGNEHLASTLYLLASIPRVALLQKLSIPSDNVFEMVPSKPANPDALHTLTTLFNGGAIGEGAAAARVIYALYINSHPNFYANLISYAETVALTDNALAALDLLCAIITAKWEPLPITTQDTTARFSLPTEASLPFKAPSSGIVAVLNPPADKHVLPYLLKPAQTFSNLVGGRGDAESAAYKIAVKKFEALKLLHVGLKGLVVTGQEGLETVLAAVERRLTEGAWGVGGDVGGRIGTMEL